MHHRIRKRAQSADEEGGPGVLISFNGSQLDSHNNSHHYHYDHHNHHHNGTTTITKHNVHSPYRDGNRNRTSSVNSLNSVKSHLGYSKYYYRWAYIFCICCLLMVLLCLAILIGYFVFSVFHVGLRSRPEWIYGKPVVQHDIASCLVDLDATSSVLQGSSTSSNVVWEWHNYTTSKKQPPHRGPRLLVAQYSGFGDYAQFLNWISPVHQEYAQHHGYDYVILQGTLLQFDGIDPKCLSEMRSTFDKIPLLEMAYSLKHKYDYVLVLDTDAMIVNHRHSNQHWRELLPPDQLLAAQRAMRYDLSNTWDVNAGVMLWNLHHRDFEPLVQGWKQLAQYGRPITANDKLPSKEALRPHLETILTKNDDQYFLQTALLQAYGWWNRPVVAVLEEFKYYDGTLVKHFKRDKRSWSTNGLNERLERVKEAIREICISQRKGISFCLSHHTNEPPIDYTQRKQPEVTTWV